MNRITSRAEGCWRFLCHLCGRSQRRTAAIANFRLELVARPIASHAGSPLCRFTTAFLVSPRALDDVLLKYCRRRPSRLRYGPRRRTLQDYVHLAPPRTTVFPGRAICDPVQEISPIPLLRLRRDIYRTRINPDAGTSVPTKRPISAASRLLGKARRFIVVGPWKPQ